MENANEKILNREISKIEAAHFIIPASDNLKEIINHATNVFLRCAESAAYKLNEDSVLLSIYLHIIEMTDGIESLLHECCINPIIPLLRSVFEALISMEFISKSNYKERSLSYIYFNALNSIENLEMADPDTPRGQVFLETIKNDAYIRPPSIDIYVVRKLKKKREKLLTDPYYEIVRTEYSRVKRLLGRKPKWYSLFNDTDGECMVSIIKLAEYVRRPAEYETLYRERSRIAHANDLTRFFYTDSNGNVRVPKLRNPSTVENLTAFAAQFLLQSSICILAQYRSGDKIDDFVNSMIGRFQSLPAFSPIPKSL